MTENLFKWLLFAPLKLLHSAVNTNSTLLVSVSNEKKTLFILKHWQECVMENLSTYFVSLTATATECQVPLSGITAPS